MLDSIQKTVVQGWLYQPDASPKAHSGHERTPISKKIEVVPSSGCSYHLDIPEAKALVAQGDAIWDGPRRLIRIADKSKRGTWEVRGPRAIYEQDGDRRIGFGPKFGTLQLA